MTSFSRISADWKVFDNIRKEENSRSNLWKATLKKCSQNSSITSTSHSIDCEELAGPQGIGEVCKVYQFAELMMIRRSCTHSVLPSEGIRVKWNEKNKIKFMWG